MVCMFYGVHFYYLEEHLLLSMKRSIYVDRYQWEWQSLLQGRRFKTFQAKEDGQKICKEGNHQQGKGTQTMQLTDTCWPDSAPGLLEHLFWNDPILWQCWRSRISTMTSNHHRLQYMRSRSRAALTWVQSLIRNYLLFILCWGLYWVSKWLWICQRMHFEEL